MDVFLTKFNSSQPISTLRNNSSHLIEEFDEKLLNPDPGERVPIDKYNPRIRDEVRRHYIQNGPCQPVDHKFPKILFGNKMRQFSPGWFKDSYSRWLEYSVKKDAAFCLCCYLFKNDYVHGSTGDSFTKTGFKAWNKASERLALHVGQVNSLHHKCFNKMLDLSHQSQSIQVAFDKQSEKQRNEHRIRLNASIDVARFLLYFGLSFRGHDESDSSKNKGLFLGLLEWLAKRLPQVDRVILKHAPKNDMMTSPKIQKDIVSACAQETVKVIINDLDGDYFGILVDESKDISHHEQMALALRSNTFFAYETLIKSIQNTRTRLTLVAVAKKHKEVETFFAIVSNVLNVIGVSFKRRDKLRDHQAELLEQLLESGEVQNGKGLN
ncbi:uncharacterized protein LOC107825225 [Nicotiana tabacum]|uniref:Uncharacterized protein LOC107825225 n=1 Tax=Nicotiana tabacum TaxID=4097 RepID=A0AC58TEQ9_TOBAC